MNLVDILAAWLERRDSRGDRRYLVAYSGGMDSHVLLHAMASLRHRRGLRLCALHVDHGLQRASRHWARHCRDVAAELGVDVVVHRVPGITDEGDGPEAAARSARYRWFEQIIEPGDVLLTAHQLSDQAETVLYNLFRGAGTRGLAAMPAERDFSRGTLARPLLDTPREVLHRYARENRLQWVDDPSNALLDFDRNFIRHRVMPAILSRFPAAERNIHRSSVNAADALAILDAVAGNRLVEATLSGVLNPLSSAPVLDVSVLRSLPLADFMNLVRFWIRTGALRAPSRRRLIYLRDELVMPGHRNSARFAWNGAEIRRYRGALYLLPAITRLDRPATYWRGDSPFEVPGASFRVVAERAVGAGLAVRRLRGRDLEVDWRTADRSLPVSAGGRRRSLRKLFQEAGVPSWLRAMLPRISLDGELLCVPGVVENGAYAAAPGEAGIRFVLVDSGDAGSPCGAG